MSRYKAIIFDMDGTLFDTEKMANQAWYYIKDKYQLPVTDEFILSLKGRTRESAQPMYKKYMPADWNEELVYNDIRNYVKEYKLKHGPLPKADLKSLFSDLRKNHYKIALCSSSTRESIDFNLSFEKLHDYFNVIVDGKMTNKGKPAPDIYLKTAELLQLEPKDCLVVEDSPNGIYAGYNASMDVVMVVDTIQPTEDIIKIVNNVYDHLDDIRSILL